MEKLTFSHGNIDGVPLGVYNKDGMFHQYIQKREEQLEL